MGHSSLARLATTSVVVTAHRSTSWTRPHSWSTQSPPTPRYPKHPTVDCTCPRPTARVTRSIDAPTTARPRSSSLIGVTTRARTRLGTRSRRTRLTPWCSRKRLIAATPLRWPTHSSLASWSRPRRARVQWTSCPTAQSSWASTSLASVTTAAQSAYVKGACCFDRSTSVVLT